MINFTTNRDITQSQVVVNTEDRERLARFAGTFYISLIIFGIFAELVRQSMFGTTASATAENIRSQELLYRLALVSDLLMILSFLFVSLFLYRVFKETNSIISMYMAVFVTLSVAVLTVNMFNHYIPLILLAEPEYLSGFNQEQLEGLVMFFLSLHGSGYIIAQLFFGLWLFPLGLLVLQSGYLPRIVGYLLVIASMSQLGDMIVILLLPSIAPSISPILALPSILGEFTFAFWIAIRGINTN